MTMLLDFYQHWFVYEQDYLWFLVALGWAGVGAAWWRERRKAGALPWLPWAAGASLLTAAGEVSQLVTPIEVKPFVAPWLAWDLALGGVSALLAGGLGASALRGREGVRGFAWARGAWWIATLAAAAVRYRFPIAGGLVLTALTGGAALRLAWMSKEKKRERIALGALVLAALLATTGPLAEWAKQPHRFTEISPFGPLTAGCLIAAAGAVALALYRRAQVDVAAESSAEDVRGLVRSLGVWLAFGLLLGVVMSTWARRNFERDLIARVQLSAKLIDVEELARGLGPSFRLRTIISEVGNDGRTHPRYKSEAAASGKLASISRQLTEIERANSDINWALLATIRDGWLVEYCFSTQMPSPATPGVLGIYGQADSQIWARWSLREPTVDAPVHLYYGDSVHARAPIMKRGGPVLAWLVLDSGVAHWVAAQAQARILVFGVTSFGCVLLLLNWRTHLRERTREAVLREAEAARTANELKSAFLAKVSHELRTPIQSLLGYSELLRQRVADDPKAAAWLAALQHHGELMTRLVNDLIDLGAVETGAFRLTPRAIEPAELVVQAVESFRPRAEARGLSLACFTAADVPAWVSIDAERFRQVLANLVGNALKFTDRGGVTVSLRWVDFRLALAVRDTGPGIPPAEQGKLFTAFSRLDLASGKEGSGLGLALSSALCRSMGGELRVESDGVAGSCFVASFSAPPATPPAEQVASAPAASLRGRRVLVVDDNPLVRELFVAFLTEQGALCAAANLGAEALAQARAGGFDVVVLDLALPDGDGAEFVRPLRAHLGAVRIVGVSAHASAVDRARALTAGMDVFLTKPVALAALAQAVAENTVELLRRAPMAGVEALRERLARQFGRELPAQRNELGRLIAAEEWARVRLSAHQLKNSAMVVRDDALFDVCTGLEQAAEQADAAAAQRWWTRCSAEMERWTRATDPFA